MKNVKNTRVGIDTQHKMKSIRIGISLQSIRLHKDGYAWRAVVWVDGIQYVASYIGARLQVGLAPTERASRRRAWHVDVVRNWSLAAILNLPSDWHRRHEVMYGVREQREAIRRAALDRLGAYEMEAAL